MNLAALADAVVDRWPRLWSVGIWRTRPTPFSRYWRCCCCGWRPIRTCTPRTRFSLTWFGLFCSSQNIFPFSDNALISGSPVRSGKIDTASLYLPMLREGPNRKGFFFGEVIVIGNSAMSAHFSLTLFSSIGRVLYSSPCFAWSSFL